MRMSIERGDVQHLFSHITSDESYEENKEVWGGTMRSVRRNRTADGASDSELLDAEGSSSMLRMHLVMAFVSLVMALVLITLAMVNNATVHPRKGWRYQGQDVLTDVDHRPTRAPTPPAN